MSRRSPGRSGRSSSPAAAFIDPVRIRPCSSSPKPWERRCSRPPTGAGQSRRGHPLSVGGWWHGAPDLHAMLAEADATLVVGSRLGQTDTSGWTAPLRHLIHIDADGDWIDLNYPAEIGLVGDEGAVLGQLLEDLEGASPAKAGIWQERVGAARRQVEEQMRLEYPTEMGVLDAVANASEGNAIVTNDSLIQYWTSRQLPVERPRSYLYPAVYGTLGSALPFAIGAAVAAPDRPVISISGDGAFMFTCQELATAVQYGVNITCIICNDQGYNAMRRFQRLRYGDYTYATDLATPDFAAMAESFGARGIKLESTGELESALRDAIESAGPAVIDMPLALDIPWM
ncbi:MAG: thiamine pyrophosphate-dependent enzyme [Thermomicrobiales bacterium]